jgi:hypothetical protein
MQREVQMSAKYSCNKTSSIGFGPIPVKRVLTLGKLRRVGDAREFASGRSLYVVNVSKN